MKITTGYGGCPMAEELEQHLKTKEITTKALSLTGGVAFGTTLKNKGNHNGFKNQTFINEVGTTHKDVREKLDSFLYEMIKKEISESRVITGKSKKMKKIVSTICEDYGFKTLDEFNNSGSIIIS